MSPATLASAALPLAGLRRRLASMVYESLLLLGIWSVGFMLPHLALGIGLKIVLPGPVLLIHVIALFGIYFIWYWRNGGQTLAMQTWKLKLVTANASPPTRQQLYLRYFLSWPSLLFLGAGLVWALFDRDRQFLHDRLAGTRIIFVLPTTASPPPPAKT